jgi:signal transduction histidine kinase
MERAVSQIRALVIAANVTIFFVFIGVHGPRAPLALMIVGVAVPYAIWSLLTRPYLRWPLLGLGALTLSMDVVLITLWVLGTGGASSEFWVIYIVSVISVAMRYEMTQTVWVAVAEAAVYVTVFAIDGLRGVPLATRPTYIIICGLAAGMLARMERTHRESRAIAEELSKQNASLLARERETVERLRELDRMKTEFVASASHELRTPLTTLSGLAITLSRQRDMLTDADLQHALDAMGRQGERARMLIENLLDLSRLDSGAVPVTLEAVNLQIAAVAALESAPPPPDVEVSIDVPDSLSAMAHAGRLEQVLANLLVNAYRYGGPHVRISAEPGDKVVLKVEDDGGGVPASDLAVLFEPFARGSNVNGSFGSGLGLTISSRLIAAFGGKLAYQPSESGGACFRVELDRV